MNIYKRVFWDITGRCNSNCKYCCNGLKSHSGSTQRDLAGILQPKDFSDALDYLMSRGVILPEQTTIELYNWGEPFLHPEFETMTEVVTSKGFLFGLSTNASIIKTIPSSSLSRLEEIRFSMPGFSQESYDRIHGFSFDVICNNIKIIIKQIRAICSSVRCSIGFHLYEFNKSEISAAREFCDSLNVDFVPFYAYLNGFTMAKEYLMSQENFKNISDDIMINNLDAIRQKRPASYECPQVNILALDEYCNILLCCGTDRSEQGHVIGKLREVDFEKLPQYKKSSACCQLCSYLKIDYLWHNANE